jgi:transposase, IS5 family
MAMAGQPGFFDVDERLRELSAKGDELERLNAVVDFELFRTSLERAVPRSDRSKSGRPPFDHVLMFKVLILQASHNLSDERTEYLIKDRLSFVRFLGLGLADTVPNANTIRTFREALTRAKIEGNSAITVLFKRFDAALAAAGFLAMGGQIRPYWPCRRSPAPHRPACRHPMARCRAAACRLVSSRRARNR